MYTIDKFISKQDWYDIVSKIFNTSGKYDKKMDDPFLKKYIEIRKTEYSNYVKFALDQNRIKNLQMKIGLMHEKIGKIICKDFNNHTNSMDIYFKCNGTNYYFQVKNKENTLNSNSRKKLLEDINNLKKSDKNSKIYIVTINRWKEEKCFDNFMEINGKTFYKIITQDENFFDNLLETWTYACIYENNLEEYKKQLGL